jgi:hypothetical protein
MHSTDFYHMQSSSKQDENVEILVWNIKTSSEKKS